MANRLISFITLFLSFLISTTQGLEVSPLQLVVPQRADIMAKYIYAKHREWDTNCLFGERIYYSHLQCWNGFYEDEPPKNTFADYLNAFNSLLDSVKTVGFDSSHPIPVGRYGVISNGAHRVTASLLYGKEVSTFPLVDERDYGFGFFEKLGLEPKYIDAMALQYCELKPNTHIIAMFPSVRWCQKEVEEIILRYAKIVHKKKILLTPDGGVNLVLTMYDRELWMGNIENNYSGARYKAQCCFPDHKEEQPVYAYLVESQNLDSIKACKAEIRSLFNHFQHCAHATDTHSEAIVLARALFNRNSVHCLNHRKDFFFPRFADFLNEYQAGLSKYENDWFCVDGGAVLSAYGLRECNDFDVLHFQPDLPAFDSVFVESHNSYLPFHALPLDDILFDPDHHFFYRGVKFCSLQVLKQMKMRRNEAKDLHDISLINQVMSFEIPRTNCEKIAVE